MNYLERNKKIFEEIRGIDNLRKVGEIGRSGTGTRVFSLGSYYSNLLNEEIYLALKCGKKDDYSVQVAGELGLISLIEENLPNLLLEFPFFHGVAVDSKKNYIGSISEDFSKGGKNKVISAHKLDVLPFEIKEFLKQSSSDYDLATTSFFVNDKRRIGDFGEFFSGFNIMQWDSIFNYSKYRKRLDEFSALVKDI